MKKILFLLLAALSATTMTFAATEKTVDCGDPVTITASNVTGYHFVQWVNAADPTDVQTANPYTFTPNGDITYKAVFAINEYTITFTDAQGKWNLVDNDKYQHGATVTAPTAREKASTVEWRYEFRAWLNKTTGHEGVISPAEADAEYEAQYDAIKQQYTITFKNYDGTVLQQSDWEYNTTPEYTGPTPTKPSDGVNTYEFDGWDETIVPVTGQKIYTATFRISGTVSYTITVAANDDNFGTVSGGGTFSAGSSKTITANAKQCYKFVRWADLTEDDPANTASRTITVSANTTYTAIFEKITYKVTVVIDDSSIGQGTVKVE